MNEIKCNIGDNFDHNIHYAMDTVEVDDENMIGKIMKVYVKGYKLHDRLIRPATVSVGAKKKKKKQKKILLKHKEEFIMANNNSVIIGIDLGTTNSVVSLCNLMEMESYS